MSAVGINGHKAAQALAPGVPVALQPERPRQPPLPAYDGQAHPRLQAGLNPYASDNRGLFACDPAVQLMHHVFESATVFIGNGIDGVIVTADGWVVEETRVFASDVGPALIGRTLDSFDAKPIAGDSFLGFDGSWNNYYHWLVYGLGKTVTAAALLPPQTALLLPDYESRVGNAILRYGPDVYHGGLHASGLSWRVRRLPVGAYRVERLHYLWTVPRQPTDLLYLDGFDDYFAHVRATLPIRHPAVPRVLLSRDNAPDPRLSPAARDVVQAVAARYGFQLVCPDDLSFHAQVDLLRQADCLVAPHGAGLINTMFGRHSLRVLELNSPIDPDGSLRPCFYQAANLRRQGYMTIGGEPGEYAPDVVEEAVRRLCDPGFAS